MCRLIAFKAIRVRLVNLREVLRLSLWAVVLGHPRGVEAGLLLEVVVVPTRRLLRVESAFGFCEGVLDFFEISLECFRLSQVHRYGYFLAIRRVSLAVSDT